jgi:hypothetical protein
MFFKRKRSESPGVVGFQCFDLGSHSLILMSLREQAKDVCAGMKAITLNGPRDSLSKTLIRTMGHFSWEPNANYK